MKYVKLINNEIDFAPKNKGSILNYDKNVELMLQDGYKPFIEAERPITNRFYHIEYEETSEQISEVIVYDETQQEADEREAQQEQERINLLHMTRGDFFEGFILATGLSIPTLRSYIDTLPLTDLEKQLYYNRFDNALDFYRGYPAVSVIGHLLGMSEEQLTLFFETKDYHHLMPNVTTQQITGEE